MICPTCQTSNPDTARFCLNCGTALLAPRTIEGERRFATVLFADVVNSTALAERLDPEEWAEIMNGAFAFMTVAVTRYGGTVGRLMGDAILAFFGAPVAHENDAERAVLAGLEIRDAAREYARVIEVPDDLGFDVRVGINTGLSVLTVVGGQAMTEYTAMGDAPNIAARLQSLADPGTVRIGADTHRLVKHLFDVGAREPVTLRGKSVPIDTYEVLGIKPEPDTPRGIDSLYSPLVGRDAAFERLQRSLDRLAGGRGGFVAVVGEAGMGKSRLIAELARTASRTEIRWLEGRALSYTQSVLYYPWRQVLLASIDARESDAPEEVRANLERTVCGAHDRPHGDLPLLETVLAIESEESVRVLAEIGRDKLLGRIAEAMQAFLGALATQRPTVMVFEDAHWADPATIDLLLGLGEVVARSPLLLLCVLRPDKEAPSWTLLDRAAHAFGDDRCERIDLELLDAAQARELLDNLLPAEELSSGSRDRILQKAEGNPLFLEEVVRALIDAGHLVQQNGHWRATAEIDEVTIPDTLLGVLAARIDRLPEGTKRVAQTAAVIGRSFAQRVLADVVRVSSTDTPIDDLPAHLGVLTYEELVRERTRDPELEYIFKHALTQEAAYGQLLLRRRKELHRRTGEVLERLYGEGHDEYAPLLAHHFRLGDAWLPAARYAVRAGHRALRLHALDDALRQYEAALDALDRVPEAPPEMAIDGLLGWLDIEVLRRGHEDLAIRPVMLARVERALALARALGDERRLTQTLVAKGNILALSGFPGSGFDALLEAFDLARKLGDERLALVPYWAATEMMVNRDPRSAAERMGHVVELARTFQNKAIEAHALATRAMAHARLGDFSDAAQEIERALTVAKESDSVIKEADVNIIAGAIFYELGELERGIRHSAYGARLAEGVGGFECACSGYFVTGLGRIEERRLPEAIADLRQAIEFGTGTYMDTQLHQVHAARAVADFASGEPDAIARLEQALSTADKLGDDYGIDYAHQALGHAQLKLGRPAAAEGHLREALASYRDKGMLPYVVRVLRLLVATLEAQDRHAEAHEAQTESEEIERRLLADAPRSVDPSVSTDAMEATTP